MKQLVRLALATLISCGFWPRRSAGPDAHRNRRRAHPLDRHDAVLLGARAEAVREGRSRRHGFGRNDGAASMQAVIGKAADIGVSNTLALVTARGKNIPIVAVAAGVDVPQRHPQRSAAQNGRQPGENGQRYGRQNRRRDGAARPARHRRAKLDRAKRRRSVQGELRRNAERDDAAGARRASDRLRRRLRTLRQHDAAQWRVQAVRGAVQRGRAELHVDGVVCDGTVGDRTPGCGGRIQPRDVASREVRRRPLRPINCR